ncbi:hypothetical protein EDD18DRAFT_561564 [Armillaria luteobubalina]|uniref:DUF6535 domain-containing protein n=1 Tax=Armillaria luteobubalina TaxID=153913 RepID=A0AA39UN42_9AGAR|nr:hypothetical protein EDD18DRAFT_561564 [Armillaria luteobubalina]
MADANKHGVEATIRDHAGSTANPEDPDVQRNLPNGTFFGLRKNKLHSGGVGAAPRDYKARYPPDPYGQKMSDKARIWSIYLDEAANFDADMLAEWRDTIDVLLVFAGLFSAVLTTFVVQTSQNMQPDYSQASTFLLLEILKATALNGSQTAIPSSPTDLFSPSRSDEWLNSLWFVSLTLSLIAALVAVLIKQWLHQYVAVVSDSSARDRARIRHMRFAGLQTWQVPVIIELLPVLLHVSLALFFAGLAIFLFSLNMKVAWLVSIISAATYMTYVITLILPLVYPYCPYKVPLTLYAHRLYQLTSDYLTLRIALVVHYPYRHLFHRNSCLHLSKYHKWHEYFIHSRLKRVTLKEIEHSHIQKCATKVDAQSLHWLHSSTSNTSVHQSVLQAISAMSSSTTRYFPGRYRSALVASLHQQVERIKPFVLSPGAGAENEVVELELYCRALSLLCGQLIAKCSNEQLKMALYSLTSTEKASSVFLGILQGPLRHSLTLPSLVWKILVDVTVFSPPLRSGVLESELELMKILAGPLTTENNDDVTTIDRPTEEVKEHILDKLSVFWQYDRTKMPVTADSSLHLRAIVVFIPRIQHRLCGSTSDSDRKQIIETFRPFLDIIEHTRYQVQELRPVLDILYSLLCSEAFAIVGDLKILIRRIFMVLDAHQYIEDLIPNIRFYSIAYQCYFRSHPDCRERSENGVMTPILGRLLSPSLNEHEEIMFNLNLRDPLSSIYLRRYWATRFSVGMLCHVMLLLINEHNENILYEWVRDPAMDVLWLECLSRLIRWTSGEKFHQWAFLKRVKAIVVIQKLRNMLDYDDEESLPRYEYEAHIDANNGPWLREIPATQYQVTDSSIQ